MEGMNKEVDLALTSLALAPGNETGEASKDVAVADRTQPNTEDQQIPPQGCDQDLFKMDPNRLKRVVSNREYSRRHRNKQDEIMLSREKQIKALEASIVITRPRIKYARNHNNLLREENTSIQKKISDVTNEFSFKQAQFEELKKERDMLRLLAALQEYQRVNPWMGTSMRVIGPRFNEFVTSLDPQMLTEHYTGFGTEHMDMNQGSNNI